MLLQEERISHVLDFACMLLTMMVLVACLIQLNGGIPKHLVWS